MNITIIGEGSRFGVCGDFLGSEIDAVIKALRNMDSKCPECGEPLYVEEDIWDENENCYKRVRSDAPYCSACGYVEGGNL